MEDDELDFSNDTANEDLDFSNSNYDVGYDAYGDYGGDTNINKHSDLLKDLTNFDPAIQRRVRNWLGLEWDEDTKNYTQKREAIINDKGAKWAIGFLTTYQSKTNIITNINEREGRNFHLDIINVVWLVFPTIDDFQVKCTADWYRLCTELEHSALLVLAGAGDGKYTKFLGESVHRTENVSMQQNPQGMMPMSYNNTMPTAKPQKQSWISNMKNTLLGRT